MIGQQSMDWFWSGDDDFATYAATIQVRNRDTFAETALSRVSGFTGGGLFGGLSGGWASIELYQTVSDRGVEILNRTAAFRRNMTSVTVLLAAANCGVKGRILLHFWS